MARNRRKKPATGQNIALGPQRGSIRPHRRTHGRLGFTPEMFGAPAATADAIFPAGADEPPLHLGAWSVAPDDSPNLRGPSGLLGEVGSGVEHSAGLTRAITNIIEGRSA